MATGLSEEKRQDIGLEPDQVEGKLHIWQSESEWKMYYCWVQKTFVSFCVVASNKGHIFLAISSLTTLHIVRTILYDAQNETCGSKFP